MERGARPFAGWVPAIAWLLLLAAIVLGAGLGLRDPWPADEPRFALIARDMVESGQWFFPRVAGVLYPDKPPVFFWLIASFHALTGSLRVAFLLPSLLAALGTLWLVHDLARRLWNERIALYGAATLLVTLQFALQARTAQIDAVLAFWTTLGLYGFVRHLIGGPAWRWYFTGFAAAGAGVITKGVGFLPLLVFLPWIFAKRWRWQGLAPAGATWRWVAGPLAMLTVIAAWLVPMLVLVAISGNPEYTAYRDNILFRQTAERYAESWHHIEPFWYYLLEVIPVFWLPVTLALPWLVPAWWRDLRAKDARQLLLLGWVVLAVLFFSLSPGKRGVYLLPAVPALALAVAPHVERLMRQRGVQWLGYVVLSLFTASWALAIIYFVWLEPEKGAALVEKYDVVPWSLFALFAFTGACWMFLGLRRGMYALAGYFLSVWIIFGLHGYPLINDARSPAAMMDGVAAYIGADAELGLVDWKEQIVLQSDRPVVHFGFRRRDIQAEAEEGLRWLLGGDKRYLLLSNAGLHECLDRSRLKHAGYMHRTDWWIAGVDSVRADCREPLLDKAPPKAVRALAPPGDIVATWSNIRPAREEFGYDPGTSIEAELEKFVARYRDYHAV